MHRLLALAVTVVVCIVPAWSAAQQAARASGEVVRELKLPAGRFDRAPTPSWVTPMTLATEPIRDAYAIRLIDLQFRVTSETEAYVRFAAVANDSAAVGAIGQLSLDFVPEYQSMQLHAINVHRHGEIIDQTHSAAIRFLQRETALEQGIYSGVVTASILVSDLRVGDTLEYAYSVIGRNPVLGAKFARLIPWDGDRVLHRRIVLNADDGRQIAHRFIAPPAAHSPTPTVSVANGMRRTVFEERDLPEIRLEGSYPLDYSPLRLLQFSEFNSWNEVASWATELFRLPRALDGEARALVERLRALPTRHEQAMAALQWVQQEIRYFSVSLGESSHRPSPPAETVARRFGDCKDKSILLVAVLRELGIRADPALIALGNNRRVGLQLPSAGQFDHVIVRLELDGQAYFVDPTLHKQTGKLDRIGQPHEGALVLVVDGAAAALTEIVSPRPDVLYAHTVDEVLTVADLDKAGTLEVTTTYRGLLAERARFQFGRVKVDDMRQSLIQRIARRYRDAKWLADPRIEDDPLENRLAVTERFEVPRPADASSEGWRIPYSPAIIAAATTAPTPQDRRSPLILYGFPADVRYSFEARFPAHVNGFLEPSGVAVRNKYFEFEGSSRFRGNVARDERRIRVIADAVPAADIHTYEKDLRKVLDLPASVIVSKRMVTTKEQLAQAPEASIEQRMRSEMEEVVKRVSASIEEGKLAGRDLAAAYAERASARGTLRRLDDALADANQAVKLAPRSAEAVAARAAIFYQRNETARAVTDYDRALALGPRDAAMLYADRGRALFFAGKFDNAALDFAQAVKVAEDHEQAAFHRLWLLIALQRGGQPLDPALRAAIENKADGDWPRPLAALLLGNRKPVDVLRIAQGKSGDERLMALCEAHFYIGQHYLIQGDPVRAQEHFERAIATRVILYVEYVAAAHELKRLRGKK